MVEPLVSALMLGAMLGGYTAWSRLRDRQVDRAWRELAATLHLVGDERRLTGRVGEVVLELAMEGPDGMSLCAHIPGRPMFQLVPLREVGVVDTRALRTGDPDFDAVYWANRQSAHLMAVLAPTVRRTLLASGGRITVSDGRVWHRWGTRPSSAGPVRRLVTTVVDLAAQLGARGDPYEGLAGRLAEEPAIGVRIAGFQLLRKWAPVELQLQAARALENDTAPGVVRLVEVVLVRHGTPAERHRIDARRRARHPGNAGAVSLAGETAHGALSVTAAGDAPAPESE